MRLKPALAAAACVAALLPALAHRPAGRAHRPDRRHLRGALHVHGARSRDARGTVDAIARAARAAGLDFVVVTDHNDDGAAAEAGYRHGVLVLAGQEKSTDAGHALVLGASPLPWRLDGEPAAVFEDAAALGAFVIAAHPGSTRPESTWTAGCEGLAGVEVVNFAEPAAWPHGAGLAWPLLRYPFDPRGALLSALRVPDSGARLWDACLAERPTAGWLGSDAHGGLPSHRAVFALGSNHLLLDEPADGDAAHDTALVWTALRAGHGYLALDGLADASGFRMQATAGDAGAGPGGTLVAASGARLTADADGPAGTQLVLLRDGESVGHGPRIDAAVETPGAYRVVAYLPDRLVPGGRRLPWIVSNAVTVIDPRAARPGPPPAATPPEAPAETRETFDGPLAPSWQIDRAPDADASARIEDGALRFDFRLGTGARTYASLADYRPRDFSGASGLAFRVRASGRFRFDVQVRVQDGPGVRTWRRSVRAEPAWRPACVPFDALRTYDRRGGTPDRKHVTGVYFFVETAHLPPGSAATLWIDALGLVP